MAKRKRPGRRERMAMRRDRETRFCVSGLNYGPSCADVDRLADWRVGPKQWGYKPRGTHTPGRSLLKG